jgi:nicotinamide riboside kinase
MTKLIGVSGAHGTGKTSTIERMSKHQHENITIDHFKISRRILASLKMSLEEATATAELTKVYQQAVLDLKISRDKLYSHAPNSNYSVVVDRSIADIYAYTRLWCEKNNVDKQWFDKFESECIRAISAYDLILLFPANKFPFVDDGIRAKEDTQSIISEYIFNFAQTYAKQVAVIEMIDVDDRVNEILYLINNVVK